MRRRAQLGLGLTPFLVTAIALAGGTSESKKDVGDGLIVYFRSADALALADQDLATYPTATAGESKPFVRDFPDAPPQISHEIEDMYPITIKDNECLECHSPENAAEGDIPIPESHFMAPIMGKGGAGQPMAWVVERYEKGKALYGARHNCNMCHAPQATNAHTPRNTFEPARAKK